MTDRPNVLVIITDQQRADALGTVTPWLQTPHLDALAARGVRFENAYTTSPQCIPARAGLMTGRYSHNHGIWANKDYTIPADGDNWIKRFQSAGYRTATFGKSHLIVHRGDLRKKEPALLAAGFDVAEEVPGARATLATKGRLNKLWNDAGVRDAHIKDLKDRYATKPWLVRPTTLPFDLYPDVWIARRAAQYLREELSRDQPWLTVVGFTGPHEPWDTPEPYATRYSPAAMPPPVEWKSPIGLSAGAKAMRKLTRGRWPKKTPHGALFNRLAKKPALSQADVAAMRADYAGHVTLIDDLVGEILAAVAQRGDAGNTIVVFTADHGEQNGDHGLIYKQVLTGPSVRIPMLISVPPTVAPTATGSVAKHPVELPDIGQTVLELALGSPQPPVGFARSLVPSLTDPAVPSRDAALSEYFNEIMIATPEWKLAQNRNGRPYLMFDLTKDPDETINLVGKKKYAAKQKQLHQQLKQTVKATSKR